MFIREFCPMGLVFSGKRKCPSPMLRHFDDKAGIAA